jgi:DNA-binding NarL/FixJ family response regulator
MMSRPRLLLADDHLETAAQLCDLLEQEFDVIGHVTDGRTLVCEAARLLPDVIVSDISMSEMDGITAASLILEVNPMARIVLISVHADPLLVARGLATGALGYVLKLAAGDDLVPAVHAALRGDRHVSSCMQEEELRRSRR